MELKGIWKAGKILYQSDDGADFITVDEFNTLADDTTDDLMKYLSTSLLDFKSDGTMQMYFVISKDEVDNIREEGFKIIDDTYALLNTFTWKEEDGIVYYSCDEFDIHDMPTEFDDDGGLIVVGTVIYYKQKK